MLTNVDHILVTILVLIITFSRGQSQPPETSSPSLRTHLLSPATFPLLGVTASYDQRTLYIFFPAVTFTLNLASGGSLSADESELYVGQAARQPPWQQLPIFGAIAQALAAKSERLQPNLTPTIHFLSSEYLLVSVPYRPDEWQPNAHNASRLYVSRHLGDLGVGGRLFDHLSADRSFAVVSRLGAQVAGASSPSAEASCFLLWTDYESYEVPTVRISKGIVEGVKSGSENNNIKLRLPLAKDHSYQQESGNWQSVDDWPIYLSVDAASRTATIYNGNAKLARPLPPGSQLLDLSRAPVFGFITAGRLLHLWLPAHRLVLLMADPTSLYEQLGKGRPSTSVSLQLKTVPFEEYFREGSFPGGEGGSGGRPSNGTDDDDPSPLKTLLVKAALIGLLVSLSVAVLGALLCGRWSCCGCCGRSLSAGAAAGNLGAGGGGKQGKRRKGTKSLERNRTGWGPLRLMDILPFSRVVSSGEGGSSGGGRHGRGAALPSISSSNSTLKTHQISKTPTHSGTGLASSSSQGAIAGAAGGSPGSPGQAKSSQLSLRVGKNLLAPSVCLTKERRLD